MPKTLREEWPRIRSLVIKGDSFYRVDARKNGTNGRQETFKLLKEAEKRAAEIAKNLSQDGHESLSFPVELRGMALTASALLKPYDKSILQAAEFYKTHLDAVKLKEESALVPVIAKAWLADKKSGKTKRLRGQTLQGIKQATAMLTKIFEGKRMLEITTDDMREYLDNLKVGLRRKFNINSRFSQFFNWSIKKGHTKTNPCAAIEIHVDGKDVLILAPEEVLALLKLCEAKHKDLQLYHAISLFAGLRPEECQALNWENIHLEEQTITVLADTSKTKETRNVHIEPTLLAWLEDHKPKKPTGFVTAQENFKKRTLGLHVDLGYRGKGENEKAPAWPQDVLRHSYGSYWLAKFKNRAQLAENMGNSLQIIKKHYKKVVSKSAVAEFWSLVPGYEGQGIVNTSMPTEKEIKARRAQRLAKALG